jgi:hypothetical protein
MIPEETDEIQRIDIVERAVLKLEEFFQVGFLVVHDEVVWGTIHQADQFAAFFDDGYALSPG